MKVDTNEFLEEDSHVKCSNPHLCQALRDFYKCLTTVMQPDYVVSSPRVKHPSESVGKSGKYPSPCSAERNVAEEARQGKCDERILSLDEVTAQQIEKALILTKGKINGSGGAAEILKVHPSTLRHKMVKLGIAYGRNRKN